MGAYYTVRRWDPERRRITIWVVVHGHDAGVGRWFEQCRVGDRVVIWGPRHSFSPPVEAREQLLVADETGFAAVVALLDETPPGRPSTVVLETIDEQHTIDLSGFPDVTVRWLFRGDAEPGTGDALLRAVRDIDLDAAGLVAFGAAESRQITAVRRHLRRRRRHARGERVHDRLLATRRRLTCREVPDPARQVQPLMSARMFSRSSACSSSIDEDVLEHPAGRRVLVAQPADDLAVALDRHPLGDQVFLDHLEQVRCSRRTRSGERLARPSGSKFG